MIRFALILLALFLSSFEDRKEIPQDTIEYNKQQSYIDFYNPFIEPIEVYVFYIGNGKTRFVTSLWIPGNYGARFPVGNELISNYAYSTSNTEAISIVYSNEIILY